MPLRPTTRPSPRSVFSSCPLMRQIFLSRVLANAGDCGASDQRRTQQNYNESLHVRFPTPCFKSSSSRTLSLERLPAVVPLREPASFDAVVHEALLANSNPPLGNIVAADRAVRSDRLAANDARHRLFPDFVVVLDFAVTFDHEVAVRPNIDDFRRDAKRQRVRRRDVGLGLVLAIELALESAGRRYPAAPA